MAWTKVLEDENKNVITKLLQEFDIKNVDKLDSFRLLCYFGIYRDTVFNRLQMNDLIKDLDDLKSIENNLLIEEIHSLAIRCKTNPHLNLTFLW